MRSAGSRGTTTSPKSLRRRWNGNENSLQAIGAREPSRAHRMKIRRPRTLLGMVLMGLAFVTVPLLVAVGNAMIKLGQLAGESEVVLADSATATLENQRLANSLERMERTVRQYFLLQNVVSAGESLN